MRDYWHDFSHPRLSTTVLIKCTSETSCQARNAAWSKLEALKQKTPEMPQDGGYRLVRQDVRPTPLVL
jgi:hypothetical protein